MAAMTPDPVLDYGHNQHRPPATNQVVSLRRLASLACKLIALWLFSQSAGQVMVVVGMVVGSVTSNLSGSRGLWAGEMAAPVVTLVIAAGPIMAGVFLWVRADRLAARMVADDTSALPVGYGVGYEGLLSIGLTVAGAAVVVPVARDLATAVVYAARAHTDFFGWWHDPYCVRSFWSAGVGLGLSAWLLFGGRGIARLIVWARTAGRPEAVPAQPPA